MFRLLGRVSALIRGHLWPKRFWAYGIPLKSGCEVRDSKVWLSKLMNGYANYSELPMLYNGGLLTCSNEKNKKKNGGSLLSCILMFIQQSLFQVLLKVYYSNEPLAINGGRSTVRYVLLCRKWQIRSVSRTKISRRGEYFISRECSSLCRRKLSIINSALVYDHFFSLRFAWCDSGKNALQQLELILAQR